MKNVTGFLLALLCLNTFTLGQTQLVKYKGSPVFGFGPSGSWEQRQVSDPVVLFDGTTYQMWYYGWDGTYGRIGYAYSADGLNWTRHPNNPVINVGPPGSIDASHLRLGGILKDTGVYHLYYGAIGTTPNRIVVCHATSADGINWTKDVINNPVLSPGVSGQWDDFLVSPLTVMKQGSVWKMWYAGSRSNQRYHTGLATSADGIHWVKDTLHNPLLPPGPSGSWDELEQWVLAVLFDGSQYKMWYAGNYPGSAIGYATSSNGFVWTKFAGNPIMIPGPEAWESQSLFWSSVLSLGNTYRIWYSGSPPINAGQIGFAIDSPSGYILPNPFALSFRDTPVGQQLDTLTVKIHNYGRQSAQITGLTVVSSNFQIWNRPTLPYSLDSNRAFDLRIIFRPQVIGALVDSLLIITNAVSTPRWIVSLSGNSTPVAVGEESSLPRVFALHQNYPNPFNPVTNFQFSVVDRQLTILKVFDVLGREVATLVNEVKQPGTYTVQWDASKHASGVYLYRLQTGSFVDVKKLILLR